MSDLHSGHRCGLTPPDWWYPRGVRQKWRDIQAACWKWYAKEIDARKPFHAIIVNGDCIDGRGDKSGSTECITTDRNEQVEMAAECIRYAQSKNTKVVIVRGTPYHTGEAEDFEDALAREVNALKIGNHEWVEVGGVVFDCKHKVGSSTIPHGRHTAIARERMWNQLWADRDESPRGDVIVRSHVHYHIYNGGPGWLAMTTPALQAMGTKYGTRQCSGIVDFGFVTFDIDGGAYTWEAVTAKLKETQPRKLSI